MWLETLTERMHVPIAFFASACVMSLCLGSLDRALPNGRRLGNAWNEAVSGPVKPTCTFSNP